MPETSWLFPNANGTHAGHSSVGMGTRSWYSTEYVRAADDRGAVIGPFGTNMANGEVTEWLRSQDFRASVPTGGIITGLSAKIRIRRTAGAVQLTALCLRGEDGTYLLPSLRRMTRTLSSSYEVITFGGPTDQWGISITRALLALPEFCVALQCKATAGNANVEVDYVQIQVHYNTDQTIQPAAPGAFGAGAVLAAAVKGSVSIVAVAPGSPSAGAVSGYVLGSIAVAPAAPGVSDAGSVLSGYVLSTARFFAAGEAGVSGAGAELSGYVKGDVSISPAVAGSPEAGAALVAVWKSDVAVVPAAAGSPESGCDTVARVVAFVRPATVGSPEAGTAIGGTKVFWDQIVLADEFDLNAQQTIIKAYPFLVTITHPDLPETFRVTDAGIQILSRGHVYEPILEDLRLPTNGRNETAEGQLTLPLQSAKVRGTFRSLPSPKPQVLIEMVYGDDFDRLAHPPWVMRMGPAQTGNGRLTVLIDDGDFERRPFPPDKFDGRWAGVHD